MRSFPILCTALLTSAAPALGQRADENAVRAAGDAFGTSVGNEKIGLYDAGNVRGFSPVTAGNIRIEGLSVTEHGGFTSRIVSGSTIRVGLTAQGYPFPAPTGIADYALRPAGDQPVLSPVAYLGPNGTVALDVDAQLPLVRDRLSVAAGVTYRYEEPFPGEDVTSVQMGGVARWRPNDRIEIKPFYGRTLVSGDRTIGAIFSGGPYLPPKVDRRYFGLDWTRSQVDRLSYGGVGSAQFSEQWQLRAGLFRWADHQQLGFAEQYQNLQRDGAAQRQLVVTSDQRAASLSGELRSSFLFEEGARRHIVHASARGRDTTRRYGGADVRDLGAAVIGTRTDIAEPEFRFGALSHDNIRQTTIGIGYHGLWPRVGELSIGVQRTDYRKNTLIPGRPLLATKASPFLYNGTVAVQLTGTLTAYAGYTTGLEESGVAPANAVNRNAATPALRTRQMDAGVRYAILPTLTLVAGVFEVGKPYFNLDSDFVFRELGTVRHRGIELSLAGQPLKGLSVVAGAILLDAKVSGDAVVQGRIGPKPVGTTPRTIRANLDYRPPFLEPLSIDLGMSSQAGEVASFVGYEALGGRQLTTEARTIFDIGARYRLKAGSTPVTIRTQVTNLFNVHAWKSASNAALRFIDARRILLTLAADL